LEERDYTALVPIPTPVWSGSGSTGHHNAIRRYQWR